MSGPVIVHDAIPRICGHCGGRLGTKRTINPNRKRQVITFIAAFVGMIGYWIFLWNFVIADQPPASTSVRLLTFVGVMRWAGLAVGLAATVAIFMVRRMPDTVRIACSACRTENVLLVRFKGPVT